MRFKQREKTKYLNIVRKNTLGCTNQELFIIARRSGHFDVDHHFLVQQDGEVEEGREPSVVAGYSLDETREALAVLVDSGETGKLTDAQKVSLKDLKDSILGTYPNIIIQNR